MRRVTSVIVILLLFLTSCGGSIFEGMEDKNTSEATSLEIARLLDEGNYDAVLTHPGVSPLDFAAAAMGKAGLDTTNLLNSLIDMALSTSTNDLSPVTQFFPINPDAQPYLDEAKNRLTEALLSSPKDYDLNFQMTILCLTDVIVELGKAMEVAGVGDPRDGISPQEATALGDAISQGTATPDINRISDDIVGIALDYLPDAGLGVNSDLGNALSSVADTIRGLDGDQSTVSSDDVIAYLQIVLGQ